MKTAQYITGGLALVLALGLAGCSSAPSGPSKTDVMKGMAQRNALERGDWKGDYTSAKKFWLGRIEPHVHHVKCQKTGIVRWTCDFHGPMGEVQIQLRHTGGHWNYIPHTAHSIGAAISHHDD